MPKVSVTKQMQEAKCEVIHGDAFELLKGIEPETFDLIISSPPYFIGKEYDVSKSVSDFESVHRELAPMLMRALKPGGSLCWQVGHHVKGGIVVPLDAIAYPIFAAIPGLFLRNRIVWTFGHGVHASRRFSGRHETILWFTKGEDYFFNLDAVRVPQKYPGKKHYKGPKKGMWSGNPLGKNPSDVWDIPNVKSRHIEKTQHPCQFPVALVQRLIKGLVPDGGVILDPFLGSGTSAVAALLEQRNFLGVEIDRKYVSIARKRIAEVSSGGDFHRPLDKPIYSPKRGESVAVRPPHFA